MAPPRPGKGLLVLDLDYTLVATDKLLHDTSASAARESIRPGMHEVSAVRSAWLCEERVPALTRSIETGLVRETKVLGTCISILRSLRVVRDTLALARGQIDRITHALGFKV